MAWLEQQLPQDDAVYLDHVGYFVEDIESVGPRLERLGFTAQPTSIHYNEGPNGQLVKSGTANRLVTFGLGYIEILAAVADTPLAAQLEQSVSRYAGLHLIALSHRDVGTRDARFAAAGFAMQPTVELRRNLDPAETDLPAGDPPGGPRQVRATVARCMPGVMPEGRAQMLTHQTPELIWRPGFDQHRNRVDALVDLLVISRDPAEAAERYARFSGCNRLRERGLHRVDLERGWLTFVDAHGAAEILPDLSIPDLPFTAALAARSSDLEHTRAVLQANGIAPVLDTGALLAVGPSEGLGAYIVFVSTAGADTWEQMKSASPSGRAP